MAASHELNDTDWFTSTSGEKYWRFYCECGTIGGRTETEQQSLDRHKKHAEEVEENDGR